MVSLNEVRSALNISDAFGNKMVSNVTTGRLDLFLESNDRMVGRIKKSQSSGKIYYHKSGLKRKEHLFRKNQSWGINNCIVEALPSGSMLLVDSDCGRYQITVEDARAYGEFLLFKQQGFELQLFIPLSRWKQSPAVKVTA